MDKLEPIIKNRFWILAGLLLPIAMYGFFSANSKLKAATQSREDALEKILKEIPGGTEDPNEKYSNGLAKINDVYKANVDRSILSIWNIQQKRMTWPTEVKSYVPEKFLSDFPYSGSTAYKRVYEKSMRNLQARVQPVMPLARGEEGAVVPPNQKVILAASIPQSRFGRFRATSEQIWDAQIDIWLLELLFDAVARLNEDKDSATEAVLRRIDKLLLIGGDGTPVLSGGKSEGGKGYGGGASGDMEGAGSGGLGESIGGSFGGSGGSGYGGGGGNQTKKSGKTVNIAFHPEQEFGSDKNTGGDSDDKEDGASASYGSGKNGKTLRYIAATDDKPYFERGFYMSVIIMQEKIPDFLVELASSDWPIRVTRFHVGKNPYYTPDSRGGGGGGNLEFGGGGDFGAFDTLGSGALGGGDETTDFGGVGAKNKGIPGVGGLIKNLPKFADAAMQNPNLVRLDLCGVITMYKQPPSIVEALKNGTPTTPDNESQNPATSDDEPSDELAVPGGSEPTENGSPDESTTPTQPEAAPSATPAETESEAVPETTEKKTNSVEPGDL